MRLRLVIALLAGGSIAALSLPCAGREPFVEFLHALKKRGYGEQGLAFIDQIADRADLPAESQESLDLERSKCLRIAAAEAYDAPQRASRLAEAKRLAEKFDAEHPNHPAAGAVLLQEGDEALDRGEQHLALARSTKDEELKAKSVRDARQALAEARTRFEAAAGRLKERLDSLPAPATDEKPDARAVQQREEFALPWVEGRSKAALCAYLLSQTYSDPEDPERVRLLKQAGREFDTVYQDFRGLQVGLLAHMWHGKTLEDRGDAVGALDIYDEVLVAAPDDKEADPELAPLFGQAQLFRLQLQAKTAQPTQLVKEGEQWLQDHKKWQSTSSYQGISLEVVKARLKSAERVRAGADRTKALRECVVALNTIGKIDSEFRHEALLLRREVVAKMGTGAALSPREALVLGDEAASDRNWTDAESFYRQSLELATKGRD